MIITINGKIGSGKDTIGKIIQCLIENPDYNKWTSHNSLLDYINSTDNKSGWKIVKFADKLKDIVCLLIGCTREQLEDREFKEKELGEEWWCWKPVEEGTGNLIPYKESTGTLPYNLIKLTPRLLLQLLGTECGRQIIHPNIWVNALMSEYITKEKLIEKLPNMSIDELHTIAGKYLSYRYNGTSEWIKERLIKVLLTVFQEPNWIITDLRFPNEFKAVKERGGVCIRVDRSNTYYMCDECDAEDIRQYELKEEDTCPRCGYYGEENLTKVFLNADKHKSETALDSAEFDFVIDNNGSIEELIEKVKEVLIKIKII